MSYSYPKSLRLRSRADFKCMRWRCTKHVGSYITIDVRKNNSSLTRLGITVTRKFGDSPQRNRFKRLVREAFRLTYPQLVKGLDLNVRPRHHQQLNLTLRDVQAELMHFLSQDISCEKSAQ